MINPSKAILNKYETQILLLAKHHYVEKKDEGLQKLYNKFYVMEDFGTKEDSFQMVSELFYKIWMARGAQYDHLYHVLITSLPENNFAVGGKSFPLFGPTRASFNSREMVWAHILSMMSYICLTEIDFFELAEINNHVLTLIPRTLAEELGYSPESFREFNKKCDAYEIQN